MKNMMKATLIAGRKCKFDKHIAQYTALIVGVRVVLKVCFNALE